MTDDQTPKQPDETQDGGISRRKLVGTGIAAVGATVIWGSPVPFSRKGVGASIDTAWAQGQEEISPHHGHKQNFSEEPPDTGNPAKVGYCSVAGNTLPDGTKLPPNTFIPLNPGQPDYDDHYTGADSRQLHRGCRHHLRLASRRLRAHGLRGQRHGPKGHVPVLRPPGQVVRLQPAQHDRVHRRDL